LVKYHKFWGKKQGILVSVVEFETWLCLDLDQEIRIEILTPEFVKIFDNSEPKFKFEKKLKIKN
jgi:hypothetical protein